MMSHMPRKRGIAENLLLGVPNVMYQHQVDLVADDFKWCQMVPPVGSESRLISSIEEAFVNPNLPMPPGPTPLWGPGGVPGEWSFVCGFLKPLGSENEWQVRVRGAFTIPFGMLIFKGNRSKLPSRSLGSLSPRQCSAGLSYITRRQISTTKVEKEELTSRPLQGKEAKSSERDPSSEWFMPSRMATHGFHMLPFCVFTNAKALPSTCSLNESESMSGYPSILRCCFCSCHCYLHIHVT